MRIVTGFSTFYDRITSAYKDAKELGLDDILMDYNRFKTESVLVGEEEIQYESEKFVKQAKNDGFQLLIGKMPVFNTWELTHYAQYRMHEVFYDSLDAARKTGVKYLWIEPYLQDEKKQWNDEEIISFYKELIPYIKTGGFKVCIKNIANIYNGQYYQGLLSDKNRFKSFIEDLNKEAGENVYSIALDIGEASRLGQAIPELVSAWNNHISMIILGENENEWPAIIRALRSVEFDGPIYMDVNENYWKMPEPLKHAYFVYIKQIADYFVWQIALERVIRKYDKRVLFGAGNMCKEYMEHFGSDYPPMFTCDNNSSLWGQKAYGLEIKSPEELKKLDSSVPIFICNTFYDEITMQLKSMNLPNPIERFNDEIL